MKKLACVLCLACLGGCSPLRHYKFAEHYPGDSSAGDLTHAAEPGARVVVPKKPAKSQQPVKSAKRPVYILAFDRPNIDCREVEHKVGTALILWACP